MKRKQWEKEVRALMRRVLKNNKRNRYGTCPACGAERFQAHYQGCDVSEARWLLEVAVEEGTP